MVSKPKTQKSKKARSITGKKFKISKHGSKTTASKVADVNSLDLGDIMNAAATSGKNQKKTKATMLSVKDLKEDQEEDRAKKEEEKKQSAEAQSLIDQLDLL